jgi:hypothetical protein
MRRGRIASASDRKPAPRSEMVARSSRCVKLRWLAAAIKVGKTLDDFLIPGADKGSVAKPTKKTWKVRKPRK